MKNFKRIASIALLVTFILTCVNICAFASDGVIYVSKSGSDKNGDGSFDNPYLTIEKAKEVAESGETVKILSGTYNVSDMFFTADNSGVTYQGEGDVVITEAKNFSVSEFTQVKNPDILEKLRPESWGKVYELGLEHYDADIDEVELYIDGKKMNISRYPNSVVEANYNSGATTYMIAQNEGTVVSEHETKYDGVFTTADERVLKWSLSGDEYLLGSFSSWYDWSIKEIESISASGEITASGSVRNNARFVACNFIEEIDVAGEYAYSTADKMLYVYLPERCNSASIVLKGTDEPLFTIRGAQDLTFENIKFDKISKKIFDTKNSDGLKIQNCEFNYINATRALVINGKEMLVDSNKVYGCTGGFVQFSGGEVTTEGFINGEVEITNNLISGCGNESYTSEMIECGMPAPEYLVDSIGNKISNNVIYNCGGKGAIAPTGNDLVVQYNEIFNISRHIYDGGAIYSGRSNTKVGNQITNNYIHHLNKNSAYYGLYSDDGLAGMTMTNNILYDMRSGLLATDGMAGNFSDNTFIDNTEAILVGARKTWTHTGTFADPDNTVDESGCYAYNYKGQKILTFYGETKKRLEEYPNAYSKYEFLTDALKRTTNFYGPYGTTIDDNTHYTNDSSNILYDVDNAVVGTDGYITEYDGTFDNNTQTTYSSLSTVLSEAGVANTGLSDTALYSEDNTFDFTPSYSDGKLKIVFDKSKNASKYLISLNGATKTYYDNNSDTAFETADVTAGTTYTIKVEAVNLGNQNEGSVAVEKEYTVPAANDKTALSYVTALLAKENEKAVEGVYTYSAGIDDSFASTLESANSTIANAEADETAVSAMEATVLDMLSSAQEERVVNSASINTPLLSDTQARVTVTAEDFAPYSYVSIVVTNPKYIKGDIATGSAEDVVRYTDVKRTGFSGELEFSFNTQVNGIDMPAYYNIYMVDENGREASSTYYYGTIEASDVSFKLENTEIAKDELIENTGKTLNASLDVNNRMNEDINAVVYCGIYEGNKLISIAMASAQTLEHNEVNTVSFDLEIPSTFTQNSTVEIMICDGDTLLKPLTVKKSITEIE